MGQEDVGLYKKFNVSRTDGKSDPGQKHESCQYFVIDMDHDPFAVSALLAYAYVCAEKYPKLAADLKDFVDKKLSDTPKVPKVFTPRNLCYGCNKEIYDYELEEGPVCPHCGEEIPISLYHDIMGDGKD